MLNDQMGAIVSQHGRTGIVTQAGAAGHAIYGNYDALAPGDYVVEFTMRAVGGPRAHADPVCAVVEVVYEQGVHSVAREDVRYSDFTDGTARCTIPFTVSAAGYYECRVWTSGEIGLDIDDHRPITHIPAGTPDPDALVAGNRFPGDEARASPFFRDNEAMFRGLYEQGVGVRIVDGAPVLTTHGVSLHARSSEDIIFIHEVFREGAYNFSADRPICAIDIGMNVGLTSLLFATRENIAEIHAFEPFPSTYAKAAGNLELNPGLAAKIRAYPFGLSDHDHLGEIAVNPESDLGARSTVGFEGGVPISIEVREAGATLQPIIADARARGLGVVVKVDCEGSEFAVFAALDRAGLLPQIDAFMVEWHAMFAGRTQEELIAPLRRNGFIAFDRSPPTGNGFFYAARLAAH